MKRFKSGGLVVFTLAFCWASESGAKPPPSSGAPQSGAPTAGAPSAAGPPSTTPAATPQASASTASFESQMLAFRAINAIAASVAANVCSVATPSKSAAVVDMPVSVVIYDQSTFANLLAFAAFVQNARSIVSSYGTFLSAADARTVTSATDATTGGTSVSKSTSISLGFNPISDLTGLRLGCDPRRRCCNRDHS
jgi:hypothetical protein